MACNPCLQLYNCICCQLFDHEFTLLKYFVGLYYGFGSVDEQLFTRTEAGEDTRNGVYLQF